MIPPSPKPPRDDGYAFLFILLVAILLLIAAHGLVDDRRWNELQQRLTQIEERCQ